MKQSVVEWQHAELMRINFEYATSKITPRDFQEQTKKNLEQAKEMEKEQQGYSEEGLLAFGKSCFYIGFEKSEKDDGNCFSAFREEIGNLIKQFKKRDEIK